MKRGFRSFLGCFLSTLIFLQHVVLSHALETNIWKERGNRLKVSSLENKIPTLTLTERTSRYGTLRGSLPDKNTASFLLHVSDIHLNQEAQKSISAMIGTLVKNQQLDLIVLEGAFEEINLQPFLDYPKPASVAQVADVFLNTHKITGPIHGLLSSNQRQIPTVIGIDDRVHYRNNIRAYQNAKGKQVSLEKTLAKTKNNLDHEKRTAYNPALKLFEKEKSLYEHQNKSLGDYLQTLKDLSQQNKISFFSPSIDIFMEATKLEKSIDFKKAEAQRNSLLALLTPHLTDQETQQLLQKAQEITSHQTSLENLFSYALQKAEAHHLKIGDISSFRTYVAYSHLYEILDTEKLLNELKTLESNIFVALCRTDKERQLVAQSQFILLAEKLTHFSLSKTEWIDYENFKKENTFKFRLEQLTEFENFYEEADIRDQKMAENLSRAIARTHAKRVLVVTGGYHSKAFRENPVGPVYYFVPRISKIEKGSASAYLNIFTQEKTPLDKIFDDNKLFLSIEPFPQRIQAQFALCLAGLDGLITPLLSRITNGFYRLQKITAQDNTSHVNVVGQHGSFDVDVPLQEKQKLDKLSLVEVDFLSKLAAILRNTIQYGFAWGRSHPQLLILIAIGIDALWGHHSGALLAMAPFAIRLANTKPFNIDDQILFPQSATLLLTRLQQREQIVDAIVQRNKSAFSGFDVIHVMEGLEKRFSTHDILLKPAATLSPEVNSHPIFDILRLYGEGFPETTIPHERFDTLTIKGLFAELKSKNNLSQMYTRDEVMRMIQALLDLHFTYYISVLTSRTWENPKANWAQIEVLHQELSTGIGNSGQAIFRDPAFYLEMLGTAPSSTPADYIPIDREGNALIRGKARVTAHVVASHLRPITTFTNAATTGATILHAPDLVSLVQSLLTLLHNYEELHNHPTTDLEKRQVVGDILQAVSAHPHALLNYSFLQNLHHIAGQHGNENPDQAKNLVNTYPINLQDHELADYERLMEKNRQQIANDIERYPEFNPDTKNFSPLFVPILFSHLYFPGFISTKIMHPKYAGFFFDDLFEFDAPETFANNRKKEFYELTIRTIKNGPFNRAAERAAGEYDDLFSSVHYHQTLQLLRNPSNSYFSLSLKRQSITGNWGGPWIWGIVMPLIEEGIRFGGARWLSQHAPFILGGIDSFWWIAGLVMPLVLAILHFPLADRPDYQKMMGARAIPFYANRVMNRLFHSIIFLMMGLCLSNDISSIFGVSALTAVFLTTAVIHIENNFLENKFGAVVNRWIRRQSIRGIEWLKMSAVPENSASIPQNFNLPAIPKQHRTNIRWYNEFIHRVGQQQVEPANLAKTYQNISPLDFSAYDLGIENIAYILDVIRQDTTLGLQLIKKLAQINNIPDEYVLEALVSPEKYADLYYQLHPYRKLAAEHYDSFLSIAEQHNWTYFWLKEHKKRGGNPPLLLNIDPHSDLDGAIDSVRYAHSAIWVLKAYEEGLISGYIHTSIVFQNGIPQMGILKHDDILKDKVGYTNPQIKSYGDLIAVFTEHEFVLTVDADAFSKVDYSPDRTSASLDLHTDPWAFPIVFSPFQEFLRKIKNRSGRSPINISGAISPDYLFQAKADDEWQHKWKVFLIRSMKELYAGKFTDGKPKAPTAEVAPLGPVQNKGMEDLGFGAVGMMHLFDLQKNNSQQTISPLTKNLWRQANKAGLLIADYILDRINIGVITPLNITLQHIETKYRKLTTGHSLLGISSLISGSIGFWKQLGVRDITRIGYLEGIGIASLGILQPSGLVLEKNPVKSIPATKTLALGLGAIVSIDGLIELMEDMLVWLRKTGSKDVDVVQRYINDLKKPELRKELLAKADQSPLKPAIQKRRQNQTTGTAVGDISEAALQVMQNPFARKKMLPENRHSLERLALFLGYLLTGEENRFAGSLNSWFEIIREEQKPQLIASFLKKGDPNFAISRANILIDRTFKETTPRSKKNILFWVEDGDNELFIKFLRDSYADHPEAKSIFFIRKTATSKFTDAENLFSMWFWQRSSYRIFVPESYDALTDSFMEGLSAKRYTLYALIGNLLNPLVVEIGLSRLNDIPKLLLLFGSQA